MSYRGAIRLIREKWRTPQALAEELFTMFASREPLVIERPVEIRVPEGQTALTIGYSTPQDDAQARRVTVARAPRPQPPDPPVQRQAEPRRPLVSIEAPPGAPRPLAGRTQDHEPDAWQSIPTVKAEDPFPLRWPPGGEAGGTSVFMGVVESQSPGKLRVTFYREGPGGAPDDEPTEVIVPLLSDDEDLVGEWVYGVFQAGEAYYYQPPVWL